MTTELPNLRLVEQRAHAAVAENSAARVESFQMVRRAVRVLAPASLRFEADERRLTFFESQRRSKGGELITFSPVGGEPQPKDSPVTVDFSLQGIELTAKATVVEWNGSSVTVRVKRLPQVRPARSKRVVPTPLTVVVSFVAEGAGLGRSFLPVLDLDDRGLRMSSTVPFEPGTELHQLRLLQHPHTLRDCEGVVRKTQRVVGPDGKQTYECSVKLKPAATVAPVDDPADLQRVTNPDRVRTILWGLSDLGYAVTLKHGSHFYRATLQHVRGPRAELPRLVCRVEPAVRLSGAVSLECTLYGSGYRCFCRVVGAEGPLLYLEPAPVVFEWHRRDEERFAIPNQLEASVSFTHPLGGTIERRLYDLSVAGCSAERTPDEPLWPGLPVTNVKLKLGGLTHAVPTGWVRSVSDHRLGLELGEMSEQAADAFRVSLAKVAVQPIELHDGDGLEPLLKLYNQVGLFEGPMAENLSLNLERATDEWRRAHRHPDGLMRTTLTRWKDGIGASSTMIRAYESSWELQHTAVASPSVPANPGQLFGTLVGLAVARDDGDYVVSFVSEGAKSQHKVMGEFFHEWSTPEFRGQTRFDLWSVPERPYQRALAGIKKLTRRDESLLETVAARAIDPVCSRALGLVQGQVSLPSTRAAFAKVGLERGREAWASVVKGTPSNVLLRSWASPGLCLSSLLSASMLLPVRPDAEGLAGLVDRVAREPLPSPQPTRFVLVPEGIDPKTLEAAGLTRLAGCTLYALHRYALLEYRRFVASRYGFLHGRFRARPTEAA